MSQELYDKLLTQYKTLGYPEIIGEPGHDLITALLSVWRECNYPDQFKIGNTALSEKCGTKPSNIAKLRKRVFDEVRFDGKALLSYRSLGQSQPGIYRISHNEEVIAKEPVEKPVKSIKKVEQPKRGKLWDAVPFKGLPELSPTQGIAQSQLEMLNRFGLNQLRHIDCRYYTPSTNDAELLYELFRKHTPRWIKERALEAREQDIANALDWMGK